MADREVTFVVRAKDAASAALKQIEDAAGKTTEALFSFKDILKGITAAVGAFSIAEVIKDMYDLGVAADKTFRQIAAALPTFTEGIGELKEQIESIAEASGRGIEEMEKAALSIAKMGVTSAGDLKQQLEASAMLADATGASVDESAQLLIQLRREFHLTGDEALQTAANLASVSKGKIGIAELQSAFVAATVVFEKFNIDADTGIRAIGTLVENGYTTSRSIRSVLGGLDASGIKELASQTQIASDALDDLRKRSDEVRGSVDATNTRLKNEFVQTIEDVGTAIVTKLNKPLEGLIGWLKLLKEGDFAALTALAQGNVVGFMAGMAHPRASTEDHAGDNDIGAGGDLSVGGDHTFKPPVSAEEKKKMEEAAVAAAKLKLELDSLAQASKVANEKAEELAKTAGEKLTQAIDQALGALTGHAAEAASQAINEHAAEMAKLVRLNDQLGVSAKSRLLGEIELTRQLQQVQGQAKGEFEKVDATIAAIGQPGVDPVAVMTALFEEQRRLLQDRAAIVALGGDDHDIAMKLVAIETARAKVTKEIGTSTKSISVDAKQHLEDVTNTARALHEAVDGALQLAEAFGMMDQKTGNMLRAVGQMATQLPVLAEQLKNFNAGTTGPDGKPLATLGSVVGAALPVVGGFATVISGLFGAASAHKEAAAALQRAAEELRTSLASYASSLDTDPVAGKLAADTQRYLDLQKQINDAYNSGALSLGEMTDKWVELNNVHKALQETIKQEAAAAEAASEWEKFRSLQDLRLQVLQSEGLSKEARLYEEQLQIQDAINAGKNDEYVATLQLLQSLQDAAADAQAAEQALSDARSKATEYLNQQRTALETSIQAQQKLATSQVQSAQAAQQATKAAVDNLNALESKLTVGALSTLGPAGQKDAAYRQVQSLFSAAQGGDKQAASNFAQAAETFLQLSEDWNASGPGFQADKQMIAQMTGALLGQYGKQESVEEQALTAANATVELLQQQSENLASAADQISQSIQTASGAQIAALYSEIQNLGNIVTQAVTASGQSLGGPIAQMLSKLGVTSDAPAIRTFDDYLAYIKHNGGDTSQIDTPANRLAWGVNAGDPDAIAQAKTVNTVSQENATRTAAQVAGAWADLRALGITPDNINDFVSDEFYAHSAHFDVPFPVFVDRHLEGIPGYANGGMFGGGLGIFGERGEELAFTGPARILSHDASVSLVAEALGTASPARSDADLHHAIRQVGSETIARLDTLIAKSQAQTKTTRRGLSAVRSRVQS